MALIIDSKPYAFSRKQLLLRTFFGWAYIVIPHVVMLLISLPKVLMNYFAIMGGIITDQKDRQEEHLVLVQFINWLGNLHLSVYNLQDGYPSLGLDGQNEIFVVKFCRVKLYAIMLIPFRLFFLILYLVLATPFLLLLTLLSFITVLITKRIPAVFFRLQLGHLDNVLGLTSKILLVK